MRILDATCGMKSMWYQKNHPLVTFLDKRNGVINTLQNGNKLVTRRTVRIYPDVVADWTADLPFDNEYFDMVVFDPPHIIRRQERKTGIMELKYGFLYEESYKQELKKGISELFRVLKDQGVFIFKWCETDRDVSEVLPLFPFRPLFGTRTGQKNNVHWIVFLKYCFEMDLENWIEV